MWPLTNYQFVIRLDFTIDLRGYLWCIRISEDDKCNAVR